MNLRIVVAPVWHANLVAFCGGAVARQGTPAACRSARETAVKSACGTAAQEVITPHNQSLNPKSPILDTRGVGQYGPRGFAGEKLGISSTSRVWTMSDGTRGGDEPGRTPEEAALSARLKHLGKRLDQIQSSRPAEPTGPRPQTNASGLARGLRLSTELVAGVIVGATIGWFLDRWLGISPLGFIVFLLLGFAAGILNVMRSAGLVANKQR
jgi:ATP synthase protein I